MRTREEIEAVLNKAAEGVDHGSKWPGMSYESGVENMGRWILGDSDENPMEE